MKKFFEWLKQHWKLVLLWLAAAGALVWGIVKLFFNSNDRTPFVKDPADRNKIIIKDPKTGQAIGVKLPDMMSNDEVKTVSKPVDVIGPVEVKHKPVNRKEDSNAKVTKKDKNGQTAPLGDGGVAPPASAAEWLGTNNPNFKG